MKWLRSSVAASRRSQDANKVEATTECLQGAIFSRVPEPVLHPEFLEGQVVSPWLVLDLPSFTSQNAASVPGRFF